MHTPTKDSAVPERALAIGAHPDDIEFGAGGTLAKWASRGCSVSLLVLTDGSKGSWEQSADQRELIAVREEEQRAAASALGAASVLFVREVDGMLRAHTDVIRRVCAFIRELKPDVVFGHDPWKRYRIHPDHRAAGWITLDALVAARDHLFFPELELAPHRPSRVLLFEPDEVHHVETITTSIDAKIAALLCHRSQWESTMGIRRDTDEAMECASFAARVRSRASSESDVLLENFAEMADI